MKTIEDIFKRVKSHQNLIDEGWNKNQICSMVDRCSIVKLRRGIFVSSKFLSELKPWEKSALDVCALFLRSPGLVFSHQSAALLLGLDLIKQPEKIHIYRAPTSRGSRKQVVCHPRLTSDTPVMSTSIGATCTNVPLTLIDLATSLPFQEAVVVADSALRKGLISLQDLELSMMGFKRKNKTKVHRVAQAVSNKSESAGETLTRLILDDLGIHYFEQYWVPGFAYRVDFFLPDYGIIIEFDGASKYSMNGNVAEQIVQEKWREDDVSAAGHRVLRTRWEQVWEYPDIFRGKLLHLLKEYERSAA
ncbi:hypothetical protein [Rothia aerolata]|nr:hypothetical protein [Rothia aerolata]